MYHKNMKQILTKCENSFSFFQLGTPIQSCNHKKISDFFFQTDGKIVNEK